MRTIFLLVGTVTAIVGIGMILSWRSKKKEYDDIRQRKIATVAGAMIGGGDPFLAAARATRSGKNAEKPKAETLIGGIICLAVGCFLILAGLLVK